MEIGEDERMKMKELVLDCMPSLPQEAIVEILTRLPIKCLMKCKSVCKDWCALITDLYFIDNHTRHTREKYPAPPLNYNVEIQSEWRSRTAGGLIRQSSRESSDRSKSGITSEEETIRKTFQYIHSTNGIILEQSYATSLYRIRNPATRQLLYLPSPNHDSFAMSFDCEASGVYKLVSVYCQTNSTSSGGIEVLTLGGDERSWRILEVPSLDDFSDEERVKLVRALNGFWHIIRRDKAEVVTLELKTESIITTVYPPYFFMNWFKVYAFPWIENAKKNLSIAEMRKHDLKVMVLEDCKGEFIQRKVIVPLKFLMKHPEFEGKLRPYHFIEGKMMFKYEDEQVMAYDIEQETFKLEKEVKRGPNDVISIVSFKGMMPQ